MDDLMQNELSKKLAALREEHRDLDILIAQLTKNPPFDQIQLQRLKKRKLLFRDEIAWLEGRLLPDIIA